MAIESLVVDDEPLARDLLAGYVKQTPFLHFAGACSSAVEALTVLQREKIDLIFWISRCRSSTGWSFRG